MIDGLLKSFWITQCAVMLPAYVWLNAILWNDIRIRHVFPVSTAFVVLMFVDVYTVWFEGYPVLSVKAAAMLAAFLLADWSIFVLVWQKVRGVHYSDHHEGSDWSNK